MSQPRFGRMIVLLCMGLAAACTSGTEGGTAGNTELNLDIVNPNGTSGELGFAIDRVDYRITCDATDPATAPIPPADTNGTVYNYDDEVDITGQFEVVDSRDPPVWQAVMDLPPGDCTVTLSVLDPDGDLVCVGSQTLAITEDGLTKYDIVLVCSLSVDLPDGMADVDGTFDFITGNLCPKLYTLNAIPTDIVQDASNPNAATEMQYRAKDPDSTCGDRCDPQLCSGANPPVCTPSPVNPADVRCNALFGGGLTCGDTNAALPGYCPLCADTVNFPPTGPNPCCYGVDLSAGGGPVLPAATGLVCQLTAIATIDGLPAGTFISPADGTSAVGPVLPVNLEDPFSDGAGITIPGIDAEYRCDTTKPGPVVMNLDCTDGDNVCDQNKQYLVNCPGVNWCVDVPVDCTSGSVCTTDGTCDGTCEPGTGCVRCPGVGNPTNDGGACSEAGGQVCSGGACVECLADAECTSLPAAPDACQLPNTCDTGSNTCVAGGTAPAGSPCDRGSGLGPGECDGSGPTVAACQFVVIDPPAQTLAITLGCTNNLTPDISILPWEMVADPDVLVDGSASSIDYTGTAIFTESFLDAGLAAVPGLNQAALQQGNRGGATIVPKAGLTGANIEIEPAPIPLTCSGGMNAGGSCTTEAECPPVGYFPCTEVVVIPTIDGSTDACAACNALGAPKDSQCADNDFCIAPGGLPIPLDNVTGNYTAVANPDSVLIGWDETNQTGLDGDGAYIIPAASFGAPWQPGGLRVVVGVLQIALNCVMGEDSGGPNGIGVPDKASPTPNSALMSFGIQIP